MTKEISITHVDTQETKEQIGEKKHVELEHEKLFREYNIDPKRVHNGDTTIPIPREWIPEIIELNINSVDINPTYIQHSKTNKIFTLSFTSDEEAKSFDSKFSANIFSNINNYIETQGKNVKTYHRNIIFTKKIDGLKITFEY